MDHSGLNKLGLLWGNILYILYSFKKLNEVLIELLYKIHFGFIWVRETQCTAVKFLEALQRARIV